MANEPFNTHRAPYPSKLEPPTNAPIRAAFQKLPVRKYIAITETRHAHADRSIARSCSFSIRDLALSKTAISIARAAGPCNLKASQNDGRGSVTRRRQ